VTTYPLAVNSMLATADSAVLSAAPAMIVEKIEQSKTARLIYILMEFFPKVVIRDGVTGKASLNLAV